MVARNVARQPDVTLDAHDRVLVVEDDDGMREAIQMLLHVAGVPCVAYESAEALLSGGAIDASVCVVSDVKLPAMSGLELRAALRSRGPLPPVIVITAHDSPAMRREATRLGAAAYLAKPFSGAALLAAVDTVLHPRASP